MFNRWIIYQWSIFHSYVKLSEGNPVDDFLCELRIRTCPTLWTFSVRFGFGFLPNPQMEEQFREDPDLIGARKKPNNHHSATWSSSGFFCEFCHWLVRNQITNQVTLQIVYSNDLEEPDYVIDSILQHLGLADTNCDINDFIFPATGLQTHLCPAIESPTRRGCLGRCYLWQRQNTPDLRQRSFWDDGWCSSTSASSAFGTVPDIVFGLWIYGCVGWFFG